MLAMLVLLRLEAAWVAGIVVVDDGPITICEILTDVVWGTTAVVPGTVLSVTVGTPATVEHKFSKARNENAYS